MTVNDIIEKYDESKLADEAVAAGAGAREALLALAEADPGAARSMREDFRGWGADRQSEFVDAAAGGDPAARRTWTRLLCGIRELPGGGIALARD